jgi:serine/threonine protein kinase/tetratricopeptide (TPR) repeat protein
MVHETLGHYRIVEKIGEGGMGVVYRAHDERLDRDVALKVLPPGTLADEGTRKRFRKEALALSKLNHPNIATVHDFDTQDGVDFLVMEYIVGTTLSQRLNDGALSEKEVIALGSQIVSALEEAHERGVVLRDLKPGNILVTPKGHVKVLDFGLAMLLKPVDGADATQSLTQTHGVSGTLPYMAPEQLRRGSADPRTDVYAVGTVLYEMATGRRPFEHKLPTALADDILHTSPSSPSALQPQLSAKLEDIILKCLEKDPENRYQSAKELTVDLRRLSGPTSHVGIPAVRPSRRVWRLPIAVALVVVLMAIVAFVLVRSHLLGARGEAIDSLAILPFENAGSNPDTEYLSDGLTESLINNVSQLPNLKVIARSSVFRYKGRAVDPRAVGRELAARAILTGRVVERGANLSISTELVDAQDDRHIWGEQYNVKLTDLLAIQEEISKEITANLRLRLGGDAEKHLTKHYTQNVEAYQLYLKGRYYSDQFTQEGVQRGIQYFHQAIEKDPNYALAYAGIAQAYFAVSSQFLSPRDAMPKVKDASSKALELDDTLAEAHTFLGMFKSFYDHDYPAAESQFKRGTELNPGSAFVHQWYAYHLTAMGREGEALTELKRARELDPLSDTVSLLFSVCFLFSRQYDQAMEQSRKMIEADPNFWWGHFLLGWAEAQTGEYEKAIQSLDRATHLDASPYAEAYLGYTYALSGKKDKARTVLRDLEEKSKQVYVPRYQIAVVYVGLGEKDKALELLQKAYDDREEVFLNVNPTWDSLRSDPRFQGLLHRAGLN